MASPGKNLNHRPEAELYVLGISLEEPLECMAGGFGKLRLEPGWFLYVGRSTRGWTTRLKRFAGNDSDNFWHVDYPVAKAGGWDAVLPVESPGDFECRLAGKLSTLEGSEPIPGFGNSDCEAPCQSHGFQMNGRIEFLRRRLQNENWECGPILRHGDNQIEWSGSVTETH